VVLIAALAAGCAAEGTSDAEPARTAESPPATAEPAASASPLPPPKRTGPSLPRLRGDVLAVTRGRTTTFMTLGGRELGQLRGYSAWTGTRPLLQKRRALWTVRAGRAVGVTERWNVPVRRHGTMCGILARLARGELLSCLRIPGGEPLLLRARGAVRSLVPSMADRAGHWSNAFVSPDGGHLLLTWSAECEVPTAFVAPARGGRPVPVTGEADWTKAPESVGLGWARDGRALVHLQGGACGTGAPRPGVYAFDRRGGSAYITGPVQSAAFFPGADRTQADG
jgi:hypothetical protein